MEAPWLRIDDRLLHGQVLVAWAAALRPERILLASDAVASDPVRRAVYAALPQDDYELAVVGLSAAAAELRPGRRILAVCGSPADALCLVEAGAAVRHVNVGGLHHAESKRQILGYVFVSSADVVALRALVDRGLEVEARDLPASRGVRLDAAALDRVGF